MAITADALNKMEFTFAYTRQVDRSGREELRPLPWARVKFGSTSEPTEYVMPLPHIPLATRGGDASQLRPYRSFVEFQPDRPFPLETDAASRSNTGPARSVGVHYFGGV